jgi:hypothetical protein
VKVNFLTNLNDVMDLKAYQKYDKASKEMIEVNFPQLLQIYRDNHNFVDIR